MSYEAIRNLLRQYGKLEMQVGHRRQLWQEEKSELLIRILKSYIETYGFEDVQVSKNSDYKNWESVSFVINKRASGISTQNANGPGFRILMKTDAVLTFGQTTAGYIAISVQLPHIEDLSEAKTPKTISFIDPTGITVENIEKYFTIFLKDLIEDEMEQQRLLDTDSSIAV